MATKSLFGLDQSTKEEVSSWIQNEQQCVTAHRIAQTMMVSRSEASLLLQEIVHDEKFPCEITTCRQLKEDDSNDKVHTTGKISWIESSYSPCRSDGFAALFST